jgi:YHS domain-containing protein
MSLDTIVTLALFAGALFLMMRLGHGGHALGCGGHAMGHAHSHVGSGSADPAAAGGASRLLSADRDVDPVCGMAVDKASAKSAVHQGQVYYFCSQTCRDKFEAAPATYAKTAGAAAHGSGHRHACC